MNAIPAFRPVSAGYDIQTGNIRHGLDSSPVCAKRREKGHMAAPDLTNTLKKSLFIYTYLST
jgi:hypothetical protein